MITEFNFEEDGFLVARKLIPQNKIEAYLEWYEETESYPNTRYKTCPQMLDILCGEEIKELFEHIDRDVILHSCITRFFHNGTQWHCDMLPNEEQNDHIAVWVALGSVDREHGMFQIIAGSHLWEFDRENSVLSPSEDNPIPEPIDYAIMDHGDPHPFWFKAEAGDVLVWHGNTIHGAQAPRETPRRPSLIGHYGKHDSAVQHRNGCKYLP